MTNETECPIKECIDTETPIPENTIAHTIKTKKPEMSNIEHLERAKAVWKMAKELGVSITIWGESVQRLLNTPEARGLLLMTDNGEVDFRSSKL